MVSDIKSIITLVLIQLSIIECFTLQQPVHPHLHEAANNKIKYVTRINKPCTFYHLSSSSSVLSSKKKDDDELISDFCKGTNEFWKKLVIIPVRDYVEIQPSGTSRTDVVSKLIAPPEVPGISRPVWLTILGSVPTGLGWYGYYKFSVEEELYQYELKTEGKVSGCGGYGTLFPFVYGVIIGFPLSLLPLPFGGLILQASGLWILLGQVNLYRRVNELCDEKKKRIGIERTTTAFLVGITSSTIGRCCGFETSSLLE